MNKWIGVSLLALATSAWATQTITFQVNMSVQEALGNFTPGSDNVVVRGNFNGWGGTNPTLSPVGGGVYSGTYDLDDTLIGETVEYKFVNARTDGDVWETVDNRTFVVGNTGAQTVDGGYFNNITEVPSLVDAEITFLVNMEIMIENGSQGHAALQLSFGGHRPLPARDLRPDEGHCCASIRMCEFY